MKKFITYAVMSAYLTVTVMPAQAQYPYQSGGLPKVVVYVSEHRGYTTAEESALRTATLNTLVRSGRYDVIERSNIIDAELMKQASGAVDDDQLTTLGRQSGSQYICIADMTNISGRDYQVSVRMIDVETAEVLAFGAVNRSISSGGGLADAVVDAVDRMLATVQPIKAVNMPKMAVYVTGARAKQREGDVLYSCMLEALLARSRQLGTFKVIERSDAFTRQIDREQTTQRSGHIDDDQIARLGKQYGIGNILVASMDYAMNTYIISSRIINVETANVEKASEIKRIGSDMRGISKISVEMVEDVMELTRAEGQERAENAASAEAIAAKNNAEYEEKRRAERKQTIIAGLIGIPIIIGIFVLIYVLGNPKEDTGAGSGGRTGR